MLKNSRLKRRQQVILLQSLFYPVSNWQNKSTISHMVRVTRFVLRKIWIPWNVMWSHPIPYMFVMQTAGCRCFLLKLSSFQIQKLVFHLRFASDSLRPMTCSDWFNMLNILGITFTPPCRDWVPLLPVVWILCRCLGIHNVDYEFIVWNKNS